MNRFEEENIAMMSFSLQVCLSFSAEGASKAADLVPENEEPICLVVGAIAKGAINVDYTEKDVCIGNYPLSAALTCAKV